MDPHTQSLVTSFLNTSPLWTNSQFGIDQFEFPETDLSRVNEIKFEPRMRLGHKMECIFWSLMQAQERYEPINRNIVIRKDGKTLGEIDFLLRDLFHDKLIHLELAYKFYLVDTDISEPIYQLVGPNRRDMFFTKLDKLKENQFSLPQTPEGRMFFAKQNIDPEVLTQLVCFKAQLFKPYGNSKIGIRPLNKNCVEGFWLRFDDFQSADFKSCEYYLPSKEEWIIKPSYKDYWISHYTASLELNLRMLKQSSAMVWMKKGKGNYEKFFVVWW